MSPQLDPSGWIGIPYCYGGRTRMGCDCFGLIQMVLKEIGLVLDDPAQSWPEDWFHKTQNEWYLIEILKRTRRINEDEEIRSYDLIYFRGSTKKVTHAGLIADEKHFLHSLKGVGSLLSRRDAWRSRTKGIARFKELC